MKAKQTLFKGPQGSGRLFGTYYKGQPWVTNGSWAAIMEMVSGLTSEQMTSFASCKGWKQANGTFTEVDNPINLPAMLENAQKSCSIALKISPLSMGSGKDRIGFLLGDGLTVAVVQTYLPPIRDLKLIGSTILSYITCLDKADSCLAVVMPYNIERPNPAGTWEDVRQLTPPPSQP